MKEINSDITKGGKSMYYDSDYVMFISKKKFCEECDQLHDERDMINDICSDCSSDKRNNNIEKILNNG